MRFLLIGATGFIGRHITAEVRASSGGEVVNFSRKVPIDRIPRVSYMEGDRNDGQAVADALTSVRPDVLIDCVLSSGKQAQAIASAASRSGVKRLIALSSMDVYRATGILHGTETGPLQELPLTEESELRLKGQTYSPEALRKVKEIFSWVDERYDKVEVERELLKSLSVQVLILRLPMVYGPGDPLHRFAQWVAPMKAQRPKISIAAGLAQWRSPRGYVINVAHAAALAAQSPTSATRVFNVAEREAFSELEWAKLIAAEMGWRGSFEIAEQRMSAAAPNYEQHWIVSSERIRTELGYSEVVPREEAVRVTAEWELENVA